MAPSPKPELPITDYLGNPLKVNDQITFVGTSSLTNRSRLYRGTIAVLSSTEMCVQSGSGLRVLNGDSYKNPDRIVFLDVALQPSTGGA